ncbi:hypothetical protein O6H91_Y571000 [Diphasiastrum complanatum]|nr:hypothetical protein O6H91_Y571000 [Diphasiastrum complanatum]
MGILGRIRVVAIVCIKVSDPFLTYGSKQMAGLLCNIISKRSNCLSSSFLKSLMIYQEKHVYLQNPFIWTTCTTASKLGLPISFLLFLLGPKTLSLLHSFCNRLIYNCIIVFRKGPTNVHATKVIYYSLPHV